jgi:hypothetical protein
MTSADGRVNVRGIDQTLWKRLRILAIQRDHPVSELLNLAIKRYLATEERLQRDENGRTSA